MPLVSKRRNHINQLVNQETAAIVTVDVELSADRDYTLYAVPPLGAGEEVIVEIVNYADETFHELIMNGNTVKLAENFNLLAFSKIGATIRLSKTLTALPTSVFLISR